MEALRREFEEARLALELELQGESGEDSDGEQQASDGQTGGGQVSNVGTSDERTVVGSQS